MADSGDRCGAPVNGARAPPSSVQFVEARGELELGRLDQGGVGHPDLVKLGVEVAFPIVEELGEGWKTGGEIQVLPDEGLENVLVIGHPVEDFGGRDAVIVELHNKTTVH